MSVLRQFVLGGVAIAMLLSARESAAEPYLAVQQGYRCAQCHVNPSGGGLRNDFGVIFAKTLLPSRQYPESAPNWTGKVFSFLRMGADLRASSSSTDVPHQATQRASGVDHLRVYGNLDLWPDTLSVYVDEQVAPGNHQELELYGRLNHPGSGLYLKGGRMYLPFGWRLQDSTSFVRGVSGISMTTPDEGFELGLERSSWSAQVDVTKGSTVSGARIGDRVTGQLVWVQPRWRFGGAYSKTSSKLGDRQAIGAFAGFRTGPVAWLGEADLVHDAGYPRGARDLVALLGEADWAVARGHNIKLTTEFFDPDRKVREDAQTRLSLLYEMSPVPFLQLRAGWRRYDGIPQSDFQNRRLLFIELHAFL